jgi:starch synthase (maltosyl-transferring)
VTGCRLLENEPITSQLAEDCRQIGVEVVQAGAVLPNGSWPSGLDRAANLPLPEALEASWQHDHPEWFVAPTSSSGPDGGAHLDFWCEGRDALWDACLRALQSRLRHGVSVFVVPQATRVPFPFWEWAIRRVRQLHPEVLFVSGATSEDLLRALARVGFSQVQIPWEASLRHVAQGVVDLQRWNNAEWCPWIEVPAASDAGATPEERHLVQLLVATASPCFGLHGMPQAQEDIDWLRLLNQLRRANRALQIRGNLRLLPTSSENLVAFHRGAPLGRNDIVVIVNCRPQDVVEAHVQLPNLRSESSAARRRDGNEDSALALEDLLDGQRRYTWRVSDYGETSNPVHLGPGVRQAHVLRVVRRERLFS